MEPSWREVWGTGSPNIGPEFCLHNSLVQKLISMPFALRDVICIVYRWIIGEQDSATRVFFSLGP